MKDSQSCYSSNKWDPCKSWGSWSPQDQVLMFWSEKWYQPAGEGGGAVVGYWGSDSKHGTHEHFQE